ncbi:MAG: hypothetical protein MR239_02610 [Clostridiales bacterium]|nr:hypothetical protein [Clostridiales bacterium]
MDFTVKCNKKDYFKCSMYYMRRYFGLRECILLAILLTAGILLQVFADMTLVLIFFGVTMLVVLVTAVLFVWTSVSGYKLELEKQGIAYHKIHFDEDSLTAVYLNAGGEQIATEKFDYSQIEAVVIRKKFIYIYAGVAIFYYLKKEEIGEEKLTDLAAYLRTNVPKEKFKFKTVKRIYPKKKKISIEGNDNENDNEN